MPISVTSAASAWVATTQKPIAPTNHRIMQPPDTPPRLDRRWRDALSARTLDLRERLLKRTLGVIHDRIARACNPAFCRCGSLHFTVHEDESALRRVLRLSTARHASADDRS